VNRSVTDRYISVDEKASASSMQPGSKHPQGWSNDCTSVRACVFDTSTCPRHVGGGTLSQSQLRCKGYEVRDYSDSHIPHTGTLGTGPGTCTGVLVVRGADANTPRSNTPDGRGKERCKTCRGELVGELVSWRVGELASAAA